MTAVRRAAISLTLVGALAGCAKPKPNTPAPDAGPPITEAEVDTQRAACAYRPGMLASQTLPTGTPTGAALPIKHIVLLMQENRSFDHYYSELDIPGLDVASPTATNPDSNGNLVQRFHLQQKCMGGGNHSWDPQHSYLTDAGPEGFVIGNGNNPTTMGYYDGTDLPYYYALAKTFAFSDRHFCSVLGPTWPNREFYFAGTSWGMTNNNTPPWNDPQGQPYPSLFSELDANGNSWRVYAQDFPTPYILPNVIANDSTHTYNQANFASDIAGGTLADVTLVEASDLQGADSPDEGPPGDVDVGQNFIGLTIQAVMNSQFWASTAIFLTYDENGGMYDHVVPPNACAPDDIPPNVVLDGPDGGVIGFTQYGFRTPFFVISPYAKHGYLSHQIGDHTAILRFVEDVFDLPALTIRDANANPPYDMFDFNNPDFTVPDIPIVQINQYDLAVCEGVDAGPPPDAGPADGG